MTRFYTEPLKLQVANARLLVAKVTSVIGHLT